MLNIAYHSKYLSYHFGPGHPFWPERAAKFIELLKEENFLYRILTPEKAEDEDIILVHTPEYLARVRRLAEEGGRLSIDTPVTPEALEASFYSVSGSILALEKAAEGERAMNLLGGLHHAETNDSSGFCIFNDHAIAIRKLQKERGIRRAAVLDIDVHAGNGTQEIFYTDPNVLTISIHQNPATFYPGTGFPWQTGAGRGKGYNLNLPLDPGTGEYEYLATLEVALKRLKEFPYEVLVLVLGVDTFKEDPLAAIELEVESYAKIGEKLKNLPNLAIMCAGGYSPRVPELWLSFLKGFL